VSIVSSSFNGNWQLHRTAGIGHDVAKAAAATFHTIYHARGILEPQDVVDAARPDDHPLHGAFEWDDGIAAEAHRRQEEIEDGEHSE